ncbi:HU family DNA-binding protein [Candidatus Curtissbacteria bacterium]|nr:HU family DNA-binding protein [Candidatus Curtissbacteria bacterium]
MTKNELVDRVAKKVGLTRKTSYQTVNAVFANIRDAMAKGDKVIITGFGTFKVRSRSTRTGRNPQTGQAIKISGHKLPGFTAGKTLRRLIK